MPANNSELERRLWTAADQLRANSRLKATEYSVPVLGLIFLRYADVRFASAKAEIESQGISGRRAISEANYHARGVVYIPEEARFSRLIHLPEGENLGKAINEAMRAIEEKNPDLKDVLPKTYNRLENSVLVELLKIFNSVPVDIEGDAFGKIYEYFLGNFALTEGQRGGEFFTATSIVKLIVEIIEPYHGLVFDPACGSGGMFVQSAAFVARHQGQQSDISVYGQERVAETVRLCRMNLAVHGLHGDIRQSNSYYDDPFNLAGKCDFLMANPPFNVNGIDKDKIKDDKARFPFGMPRADNGNYVWIQLFYSALKQTGRAGFVMANSASDARQSEGEIRRQLIQDGAVDVMVAVGSNFFYNVTLPVTLWFLDKAKKGTPREDRVLFLDARGIYQQVDRAHREFTPEQIGLLASIARLYRGEDLNGFVFERKNYTLPAAQLDALEAVFAQKQYRDVAGLCKAASRAEIEAQGWSLNPGRYVGVTEKDSEDYEFYEKLETLNEELDQLNAEAHALEQTIQDISKSILEK